MMRAKLFGGLAIDVNGAAMPQITGLKPRSVLAYLLLHPGPHPRARLAARFWPDVLDTSARASLRSALWTARAALESVGGEGYLAGDRSSVGIAPELPREVDVEIFNAALASGDVDALRRAVALATGPLLSDLVDEWVLDAQDEYRDRLIDATLRLADEAERSGDPAGAVEWTRRALERDRLREATHRELMRRLAAAGEPAQALAAYRRCRAVLAAELGMTPSRETRAEAERIRAGSGDEPDPLPVAAPAAPAETIVGRAAEIAALTAAWRTAAAGRGGLAVVTGEAGIGKSRLAAELMAAARSSGALTVAGAPLELPGGPPFGPWLELLQALVRELPVPPADASWPTDLARLCPQVTTRWGRASGVALGAPDLERARLFESVAELLTWAAAARPLLIVLEDLHRADTASLTLLAHTGRRIAELPVLVVATRRDAPPGDELDATIDAFRARGMLHAELALGPMTGDEIRRIIREVAPDIGGKVADRVAAAADGNPLFAREGARAAVAGGQPFEGIQAAIRAPLRRLPPPARLLVEVASAAARPLDRRELADAVGDEALPDALAAAADAGLLDAAGRQVRFVHELVRQACYADLTHARREWLHSRLAELIGRRSGAGAAAEVARHFRLAGDDEAARPHLVAAAQQAQRLGALDEAAGFLREAVAIPVDDRAEAVATWFALAEVEGWRERREAMDEAFDEGYRLVEPARDAAALAAAHAARGHLLRSGLCYPRESLEAYRRGLDLIDAEGIDLPEVRVLCLAGAAFGEATAGDPSTVPALIAEIAAQPEAREDGVLAVELGLVQIAAAIRDNRLDEIDGPAERTFELAERAGRPDLFYLVAANAAAAAACRGDFARTLALTEDALARRIPGPTLEGYMHAGRAYALARLGRHDEAVEAARQELRLFERYGQREFELLGAFDLGSILLAAGDAEAAAAQLDRALASPTRHFSAPLARLRVAEARLLAGDVPGARRELERFPFEPVREADMPAVLVARLARLEGFVAAAEGDSGAAERRFREAEAAWRRLTRDLPDGDMFMVALVDLGRPPVAGLVEPGVELGGVLAELARLLASDGRASEAAAAAAEAGGLADALAYDGYREILASLGEEVADARI